MNENEIHNRRPVLVLGIGNILLHDEGVGVYTIQALEMENMPDYVELLDGEMPRIMLTSDDIVEGKK